MRGVRGAPPDGYGWEEKRAEEHVQVIVEIGEVSGGGIIEPGETIDKCPDYEDNRILECGPPADRCSS